MSILTTAQKDRLAELPLHLSTHEAEEPAMPPAARIAMLCSPNVFAALGLAEGMTLEATANIEAIVGLLTTLKIAGHLFYGLTQRPVTRHACLALLARLGVKTGAKSPTRECVATCIQLGVAGTRKTKPSARLREIFCLSSTRLKHCVGILEQRGYHTRMSDRLTSLCHPVLEPTPSPHHLFGHYVSMMISDEYALAA